MSQRKRYVTVETRAIPIITDKQIERVSELLDRLEALKEEFSQIAQDLAAQLGVLDGSNQVEDWSEPTAVTEKTR